jgi:hypothetical protein
LLAAFLLYASLIRDQEAAADTALVPSGCLRRDGPALRFFDVAIPVRNLRNCPNSTGLAQNAENAEIRKTLGKRPSDRCPRFLQQIAKNAEIPG